MCWCQGARRSGMKGVAFYLFKSSRCQGINMTVHEWLLAPTRLLCLSRKTKHLHRFLSCNIRELSSKLRVGSAAALGEHLTVWSGRAQTAAWDAHLLRRRELPKRARSKVCQCMWSRARSLQQIRRHREVELWACGVILVVKMCYFFVRLLAWYEVLIALTLVPQPMQQK